MDRRHFITGSLGVLVTTGLGLSAGSSEIILTRPRTGKDEPTTLTSADLKAIHDYMKRHGAKL